MFRQRVLALYRFLPVQLFLLHFRKAQMLLLFWAVVVLTVAGKFAERFGAHTLFLAPEYQGRISVVGMGILGAAFAVFTMAWHVTTFIVHSKRIPFLGAARQAFLKYCINNSLLPLLVLVFYSICAARYQRGFEHLSAGRILLLQVGFYLGFIISILLSFLYFYRVDRDLIKTVLARLTNPAPLRHAVPYDSLDVEIDMVRADTYLHQTGGIRRMSTLRQYPHRLLQTVLRRHQRNATAATIFSLIALMILGVIGADKPALRVPAGASFLVLFSVMIAVVGAVKYVLKTWELIGWIGLALVLSWAVKRQAFDLRSMAFGMDYKTGSAEPRYDYEALKAVFTPERAAQDLRAEEARLDRWEAALGADSSAVDTGAAPLVVIAVSGGGSRSAYWTFRALQHLDSLSGGKLFRQTVFMTGASGGMIGAAWWRALHEAAAQGRVQDKYAARHQQAVGKDLLNAVIFSFAAVDLISPFNKTSIAGYTYQKDRGWALEREMVRNSGGLLDRSLLSLRDAEGSGRVPMMVVTPTIVNDGRKLLMSALPVSYLTRAAGSAGDTFNPPIDAVDYATFFSRQNPLNLRIATALRINATFPYILPAVRMPSNPRMNLMDAGLRDNFGIETAVRYISAIGPWARARGRRVILLQIRDTREHEVFPPTGQASLGAQLADPLTVIQHKWEPFQSYTHNYLQSALGAAFGDSLTIVRLQYIPQIADQSATLNFHLSQGEKEDLAAAIYHPQNRAATAAMLRVLR